MTVVQETIAGAIGQAIIRGAIGGSGSGGTSSSSGTPLVDQIAALPAALAADGGPSNQMVGLTAAGVPKRFTTNLFASRRTLDLSVLPGSDYAEWLQCVGGSGQEYRVAAAYLQHAVGGVIDPTLPPYNVRFDFQKEKPVHMDNASNTVVVTNNRFVTTDVGKRIVVGNACSLGALVGYIGQVVDAKTVKIYTDLAFTNPALSGGTVDYQEMVWGTDNTAGMQQAFNDAEAPSVNDYGKVVVLGGMALVTAVQFGSISVVGLSATGCGLAALPIAGSTAALLQDKATDLNGLKPHNWTLKDLLLLGQHYTQYYSSYRNVLDIFSGEFSAFPGVGAPYPSIDGLEIRQAQVHGMTTNATFAGQINKLRIYNCQQAGALMGNYDANGTDWHLEANGYSGVFSTMVGANISMVRSSYNGANTPQAGGGNVDELGANWCEAGYGNTVTNLRMQESWGHSLVFTDGDVYRGARNGGGSGGTFSFGTFDDTSDIPAIYGSDYRYLPNVRAMVYAKGTGSTGNLVSFVRGGHQVRGFNFATNGYADDGNPTNNTVTLTTSSAPGSDWYNGSFWIPDSINKVLGTATWTDPYGNPHTIPTTLATVASAGPSYTRGSTSISSRGNAVTINGVVQT